MTFTRRRNETQTQIGTSTFAVSMRTSVTDLYL